MARRAAPHPDFDNDKPYIGAPRRLPMVLLCNAHQHKVCGRNWVVNRVEQQEPALQARKVHELLCAAPGMAKDMALNLKGR